MTARLLYFKILQRELRRPLGPILVSVFVKSHLTSRPVSDSSQKWWFQLPPFLVCLLLTW